MAGQTIIIGNWNDTTPAAPAGSDNVKFQKDVAAPPNISANVPRADTAGTKYGTILYDGSGNADRYLGADGNWHDIPAGLLPEGGTPGQILSISDASPSAPEWIDMPAGSLPNGGTTGQVLAKASAADGDVGWVNPAGGSSPYTPPVLTDFSWVNQGTATAVQGASTVYMVVPKLGGNNCRVLVKALPAAPITISGVFNCLRFPNVDYATLYLALRESSSGELIMFRVVYSGVRQVDIIKHNSPTSYSGHYFSLSTLNYYYLAFFQIEITTGAPGERVFRLSMDGENWEEVYRQANNDFMVPDEVGFGAEANNSSADVKFSLLSWKEE